MIIYVSHSRKIDYKNELYQPLRESALAKSCHFIFPHEESEEPLMVKTFLVDKKIDAIIAEVSHPSTGQGIELGWANIYKIPITCVYKKGSNIAHSLRTVSEVFIEYQSTAELLEKLAHIFS